MTEILKGAEACEVAIANTLRQYLPDRLTAISGVWNDGVPLPVPALIHAGITDKIREVPLILVASTGGAQNTYLAPSYGEQTHTFEVSVCCASDSREVLDKQVKRYLLAIWEVLMAHPGLDGSLAGAADPMPLRYGRSRMDNGSRKPLIEQWGAWEIQLTTIEYVG